MSTSLMGNFTSLALKNNKTQYKHINNGEVPEWSNGAVSKTVVPVRVPRVRIPVSPPNNEREKYES